MKRKVFFAAGSIALLLVVACQLGATTESSAPSGAGQWAKFPEYKKGDTIIYWGGKWKPGVIKNVGVPYNPAAKQAVTFEAKYEVVDPGSTWPDWKEFSRVAGRQRESWWTAFFTGEWSLGEVMAVNTRIKGANEETEYSYKKATEKLAVLPNGTYTWVTTDGKTVKGKWVALADGPGIILQKGYKGYNWTFINESSAVTMHIRQLEAARLLPDVNAMSIAATRPMNK